MKIDLEFRDFDTDEEKALMQAMKLAMQVPAQLLYQQWIRQHNLDPEEFPLDIII